MFQNCFSKWLYQLHFSPPVWKRFGCPTSSPTFDALKFINFCQSGGFIFFIYFSFFSLFSPPKNLVVLVFISLSLVRLVISLYIYWAFMFPLLWNVHWSILFIFLLNSFFSFLLTCRSFLHILDNLLITVNIVIFFQILVPLFSFFVKVSWCCNVQLVVF